MANANSVFHRSALNRPLLSAFAAIAYLPILAANQPFVALQFVSGRRSREPIVYLLLPSCRALIAASAGIGYSQASGKPPGGGIDA